MVDDGSTDGTAEIARAAGADHVLVLGHHQGLARAFYQGLNHAFSVLRADAVVNFDADLQYLPSDIPRLVEPLLTGKASYVLGERQFDQISHWSWTKKTLQKLGALFISVLTKHRFKDVTTGFRAVNREVGLRLSVLTQYTYTVETLLNAANQDMQITAVAIQINATPTRPSRLIRNVPEYCLRAMKSAIITVLRHRSYELFLLQSGMAFVLGVAMAVMYITKSHLMRLGPTDAFDLCRMSFVLMVLLLMASIVSDNIYRQSVLDRRASV